MNSTVRAATPGDASAVAAIYAPAVRESVASFEDDPPDGDEMADRIEETSERYPWLVCERDGGVVGYAYAHEHRSRPAYQWSVDVSVYVAEAARERGVARGLYTALLDVLAEQGFRNAYAGIALPNPASVALHESVGFERLCVYENVGYKRGAWRDVEWWERPLADHDPDPDPPRPADAVADTDAWNAALDAGRAEIDDSP